MEKMQMETVQPLIRLLLQEASDLDLHCLPSVQKITVMILSFRTDMPEQTL